MANISSPTMQSFPANAAGGNDGPLPPTREQATGHVFDDDADPAGLEEPGKDRARGAIEQSIGSTKETLGKLVNSEKLAQKGAKQREAGLMQEQSGLRRDHSEGITDAVDRGVKGMLDKITPDHKEEDVPVVNHPAFASEDNLF